MGVYVGLSSWLASIISFHLALSKACFWSHCLSSLLLRCFVQSTSIAKVYESADSLIGDAMEALTGRLAEEVRLST